MQEVLVPFDPPSNAHGPVIAWTMHKGEPSVPSGMKVVKAELLVTDALLVVLQAVRCPLTNKGARCD